MSIFISVTELFDVVRVFVSFNTVVLAGTIITCNICFSIVIIEPKSGTDVSRGPYLDIWLVY